jgi:hypothetical protein
MGGVAIGGIAAGGGVAGAVAAGAGMDWNWSTKRVTEIR